jgi:deoxyadenosine/deoxycytidine kinase
MSPATSEFHYIAVEGVIGVGKTTFAGMLAEKIGARVLNEEVLENPFLVDFYRDRKRFALSCQLFFLLSRFQQQQQLQTRDLFAERIVADYLFAKDAIFASINLTDRELILYNKIAPLLSKDVPKPDLVIYLQATTPVLQQRITKRNLPFEKTVDSDYIEVLNKAYDYYFFSYRETPLLVVKTDEIDFVHNPDHFDDLVKQLSRPISGTKYYSPAGNLATL